MRVKKLAAALAVCALAGLSATPALANEEKESGKAGALPRKAPAHSAHSAHEKAAPPISTAPTPKSGSMPKGPAPKGKLGTEPTARGRLGTDPKPGESSERPPRLN